MAKQTADMTAKSLFESQQPLLNTSIFQFHKRKTQELNSYISIA